MWFYSFLVLEFLSTKIHHNPRTALTHLHIIVNYQKKKIRYNLQVGSDTVRFSLDAKYCVYLECLDSQNWFPSLPFKPCMDFNFGNCELLIRVHRMFVFHMAQLQAHNTILMDTVITKTTACISWINTAKCSTPHIKETRSQFSVWLNKKYPQPAHHTHVYIYVSQHRKKSMREQWADAATAPTNPNWEATRVASWLSGSQLPLWDFSLILPFFLLKHLLDIFTATCGLLGGEDFTLHCPWFLQQHPEAMDPCWTAHACVKERGSIGVWLRRSSDSQTENATETPALSKLSLLSNTFYSSATANG